jgi:hypothetical protein
MKSIMTFTIWCSAGINRSPELHFKTYFIALSPARIKGAEMP